MEELLRPSTILKPPWASSGVIRDEDEKQFVRYSDYQLDTLEAITARNREVFFLPAQHLLLSVSTALRAFEEDRFKAIALPCFSFSSTV